MATDRLGGRTSVSVYKNCRIGSDSLRWSATCSYFPEVIGINKNRRLACRDLADLLGMEIERILQRIEELESALRDISLTVECAKGGHE